MRDLNNVETVALAQCLKESVAKKAKKEISHNGPDPKVWDINLVVRITGQLVKLADVEKTVPAAIRWTWLAAKLFDKLNAVTGAKVAEEALADILKTQDGDEETEKEFKDRTQAMMASLVKSTKRMTSGNTNFRDGEIKCVAATVNELSPSV